jgi:hypothetical protein
MTSANRGKSDSGISSDGSPIFQGRRKPCFAQIPGLPPEFILARLAAACYMRPSSTPET